MRHRDRQRPRIQNAIAVAKLACEFHLDRQLAKLAQEIHADHPRVEGRAAARHRDLGHRAQQALIELELGGELHVVRFVDASRERLLDDARLDEHLLEHVMLEAALFRRGRIPRDLLDFALDRFSVEIGEVIPVAVDDGHLTLAHDDLLARVLQDRGRIGGDVHLVVADPDHERARAVACEHEPVRRIR